jgi:GC-rich sequence DNA-binding factor
MPQSLDQATISTSNGSPRYDAAYLKELKASTPTSRPPLPTNVDPYDADMSMDIGDISVQSIDMDVGTCSAHSFLSANAHNHEKIKIKTEESASYIPSESSIKVAKEKRGRLRQTQATGEEDFISLSVAKLEDGPKGPHPESRLMREEDELGEGEDGKPSYPTLSVISLYIFQPLEFAEYTSAQERIALGKKSRKKEASQRRVAMEEMIADAYADSLLSFRCILTSYLGKRKTRRQWNGSMNSFVGVDTEHQSPHHHRPK